MIPKSPETLGSPEFPDLPIGLKIASRPGVTAAVFNDYPHKLLEEIIDNSGSFPNRPRENAQGQRHNFSLQAGGLKLYVKPKFEPGTTAAHHKLSYRELLNQAAQMPSLGQSPEVEEIFTQALLQAATLDRLNSSALNEILINRVAVNLYGKAYNKELPIEKAVGCVVDTQGRKWAIMEFVESSRSLGEFPESLKPQLRSRLLTFTAKIARELRKIGIEPLDLDTVEPDSDYSNILITGKGLNIENLNFVIIDTERWLFAKLLSK